MNFKKISPFLGPVLLIEGILMLPAAVLCLVDGDISAFLGFFITLLPLVIVGYLIFHNRIESPDLFSKDGMVIVSVCWIAISLFGALPLFISGVTPSFIDAFFEIVSGFTTTGASILNEVENLPRGILYWRSFTNWLGGMGIVVLFVARAWAKPDGLYPKRLMVSSTFVLVASVTFPCLLMTRETVASETPAACAT